ncbi:ABC transporter permease [Caldalkalibacillus mannanilyticus]|uniref:ABC transporter permease n=1 Tax=Caldalkalibacillus mannanilyticus TaxID=1418 RepID=UPI0004696F15|nr:ABC transporter permease subunit [Caldalkalibacillus mannanilyticus]
MKQWLVLFKKECLEYIRNYKILWLPLVFVLLGFSQPITLYYLPDILQKYGDLPQESVILIPNQSSVEVLAATVSGQFDQIGILVLVLGFMGMVVTERNNGIMSLTLLRPIPYSYYITAKWAATTSLTILSLFIGYLGATYYTTILFGEVNTFTIITSFVLFILWFIFVITLTLLFSTLFKNISVVAAISMVTIITLKLITSLIPNWMHWSPARLVEHGVYFLKTGNAGEYLFLNIASVMLLIVITLVLNVICLKKVVLPRME